MKNFISIALLLISFNLSFSQAPFTTLSKVPNYVQKTQEGYKKYDIEEKFESYKATAPAKKINIQKTQLNAFLPSLKLNGVLNTEETKDIGFFKNNGLALTLINKGDNRLSVNSQVIFYKINIFTPENKISNYRYNIPLMLISKISTNYDSIQAAISVDVIDYEAFPLTLRIMSSFKISENENYKEQLLFGFYLDTRSI